MALLQQYFFDLDGPGAPPGPAPGQGAVLPGTSAQQLRPGLLLATIAQAQPPWRTDPVDADLTAVDASGLSPLAKHKDPPPTTTSPEYHMDH